MAVFERGEKTESAKFKKIVDDVSGIVAGFDGTLAKGQVLALSGVDGKYHKYIKDDVNVGNIAGIYTGEEITVTAAADVAVTISASLVAGRGDIVGIDFDTEKDADLRFKQVGVYIVAKQSGTEEVY